MSETIHEEPYPEFGLRILNHFFGRPKQVEKREEFLRRGLIPTNNLSLYVIDQPAELAPGISNFYDYRQRPFGSVMERCKQANPELWEEVKTTSEACSRVSMQYAEACISTGKSDPDLASAFDEAYWIKAEACDRLIRVLAPELLAEGIEPLEVCG